MHPFNADELLFTNGVKARLVSEGPSSNSLKKSRDEPLVKDALSEPFAAAPIEKQEGTGSENLFFVEGEFFC